jgi:hypothetical protein
VDAAALKAQALPFGGDAIAGERRVAVLLAPGAIGRIELAALDGGVWLALGLVAMNWAMRSLA